ncbi:VOC family protein [Streptomyces sp. NPDC001928]|uniref:VOC family protein n=1 Tax=Streptomyces sp. NPDC001928 TaxID=3154404 RepID=UPI00332B10C9
MTPSTDTPRLLRLNIEVAGLREAEAFYATMLGVTGRGQAGSRCYFTCGPVTLQVLDVSSHGAVHPLPKSLYFAVDDLESIFERARELDCLLPSRYTARLEVRSLCDRGERSFYVEDPWGNSLCFVEAGTVYEG